jgi:hypothetical protein
MVRHETKLDPDSWVKRQAGRTREAIGPSLAQAADGLYPAEDFFNAFTFLLTDRVDNPAAPSILESVSRIRDPPYASPANDSAVTAHVPKKQNLKGTRAPLAGILNKS